MTIKSTGGELQREHWMQVSATICALHTLVNTQISCASAQLRTAGTVTAHRKSVLRPKKKSTLN